jgi:hypothetical protein
MATCYFSGTRESSKHGLSPADILLAENEKLKAALQSANYKLRSTRAANEALKGDMEQLQTALILAKATRSGHRQDQACSWFACAPACDQGIEEPRAIIQSSFVPARQATPIREVEL